MRHIIIAAVAATTLVMPAFAQQTTPPESRQLNPELQNRDMQKPAAPVLPGQKLKPQTEGAGTPDVRERQGRDPEAERNVPPKGNINGGG